MVLAVPIAALKNEHRLSVEVLQGFSFRPWR
jgi:hypothetical protein